MDLWNHLPIPAAYIGKNGDIKERNREWDRVMGNKALTSLVYCNSTISNKRKYGPFSKEHLYHNGSPLVYIEGEDNGDRYLITSSNMEDGRIITLTEISLEVTGLCVTEAVEAYGSGDFNHLVGKSEPMRELSRLIRMASGSLSNVLISGESGTGKELISQAVHNLSDRKDKPFIAVNCSALSEQLLESELFGHVKGAFTGADRNKTGRFEAAEGGTIFLDEIGEISPMIQVKLLRVLQEKVIERVGSHEPRRVDMRIIGATNRNLREMVREGTFREDLFYRLNVFAIRSIPLREMENDLPLLCDHFLGQFQVETGKAIRGYSDDVMRLFMEYCWPGNIRELRNTIEHAFVVSPGPLIGVFDLPQELRVSGFRQGICQGKLAGFPAETAGEASRQYRVKARNIITRDQLEKVLSETNGNKSEAARRLGISRVALYNKIKRLT